jgi:hypothetical protein
VYHDHRRRSPQPLSSAAGRVSILRQRAHDLGIVEAPDEKAAEAFAVKTCDLICPDLPKVLQAAGANGWRAKLTQD